MTDPAFSISTDDMRALRLLAHRLADAARVETLRHFRAMDLADDNKKAGIAGAYDPVTVADRASEEAMRAILSSERPQDGILGEEFGTQTGQSGLTWVLDPIDGTRGYVAGTPTWGVLIAVTGPNGPLYGIIDQPYIAERFEGGFGHAELVGPHGAVALATRGARALHDAVLLSTFPEIGTDQERAGFEAVAGKVRLTRYGMDCYGYALVAAGQVDLVIEAGLEAYDICAPIAVIEAAGGVVTTWSGGPAHHGGQIVAAANPEIHRAAVEILAPFA